MSKQAVERHAERIGPCGLSILLCIARVYAFLPLKLRPGG